VAMNKNMQRMKLAYAGKLVRKQVGKDASEEEEEEEAEGEEEEGTKEKSLPRKTASASSKPPAKGMKRKRATKRERNKDKESAIHQHPPLGTWILIKFTPLVFLSVIACSTETTRTTGFPVQGFDVCLEANWIGLDRGVPGVINFPSAIMSQAEDDDRCDGELQFISYAHSTA